MKASGFLTAALALGFGTVAMAQDTFTVDINRTDGSAPIEAGGCVEFEIRGHLTDTANEGLAFFAFDLELVGPSTVNLGTAIIMGEDVSVTSFSQPQGYSVDFTGTAVGDDLIQLGGGQNTIGNPGTDPFPPFPNGAVALGVGHGVDGVRMYEAAPCDFGFGLTVPVGVADGDYTLQIRPSSLFANQITSFDDVAETYVVDPVNVVIGNPMAFTVGADCVTPAPEIVHDADTSPCSGHIDPRGESSNGVDLDLGITTFTIKFTTDVFQSDGTSPVDASNFSVGETGGGAAPSVASVSYVGGGMDTVEIVLDNNITLQEWTTLVADVYNDCGVAITSSGDQGAGVNETDRIDVTHLPTDINQGGTSDPFDVIAFRQFVNNGTVPANGCSANGVDYVDMNHNGASDPFDLIRLRQSINGVTPSTRAWASTSINNTRP